ncbi:endonuclease/exonuclease/phosphatase family protein [Christiangramia echinicola]|uniref:Endonuclease/Exonuclease/phosphatase family protein n=1 Tax=Christiangramia echinicola TaxID=279359 RepID=A0A1H1RHH6_9FLAO|nr:endonuclease/exonuclease/phosphatase family protein [Christiangramia echinicola]SDS34349.1 Endonuclease/Exonuclease/phosphatase family protein [Christiangramia echinicola]
MKIATFNIQNLFHRDRSLLDTSFDDCSTEWAMEIDQLMAKIRRTDKDNLRLRELSCMLGIDNSLQLPYAVVKRKSGFLFLKGMNYSKELKAGELTDWNGWIAVQNVPIEPLAIENKAKIIADINPDILILQEIEDRASLEEFNMDLLPKFKCIPFKHLFVVQGNDKRGQEIGILTRKGFEIESVRSHIFDQDISGRNIFNIDLLEYDIQTKDGNAIYIIASHLQETRNDNELTEIFRRDQAVRVADTYKKLFAEGKQYIAVVGTLNAASFSNSIIPLLQETNLRDVTQHQSFNVDIDKGNDAGYFSLGAYQKGVNIKQKDYLLLSPELFAKVKNCGLNRRGVWPEKRPMWSIFPSIHQKNEAASEHPAIWVEVDV